MTTSSVQRHWLHRAGILAAAFFLAAPAPASEPATLRELLERAGMLVENFTEQISGVRCREAVTQAKLNPKGKTEFKEEAIYDSLTLLRVRGNELLVDESRQIERDTSRGRKAPVMITHGFATLMLILHPYYQSSFEFSRLEDDVLDGKKCARLRFQHLRGSRSPAALQLRGHEYPLDLEGIVWIDPATGQILKISAGLPSGLSDVGIKTLQSEVRYAPVTFAGVSQTYWLPSVAHVELETPRQHWRNAHHFSEYRRYSVSVKIDMGREP